MNTATPRQAQEDTRDVHRKADHMPLKVARKVDVETSENTRQADETSQSAVLVSTISFAFFSFWAFASVSRRVGRSSMTKPLLPGSEAR